VTARGSAPGRFAVVNRGRLGEVRRLMSLPTSGVLGPARLDGPSFDLEVPPGGYAWWYVDALSDDGAEGLTIIGFVGSVFSPYYAWSGRADPANHCAVNVALYNRRGGRWAMTERPRGQVQRSLDEIRVGRSALRWDGDGLTIDVDEQAFPLPSRVTGQVRLRPEVSTQHRVPLDPGGEHVWWPIAPRSRVEVVFSHPSLKWSGTGYFDTNWGASPLEDAFVEWSWSRAPLEEGAAVLYDVTRREGGPLSMALRFDAAGAVEPFDPPPWYQLPAGAIWRVPRATRAEGTPRVSRTLEDTPFYTRSVLETRLLGRATEAVHESLCLRRFSTDWVKFLLMFRMPRARGAG